MPPRHSDLLVWRLWFAQVKYRKLGSFRKRGTTTTGHCESHADRRKLRFFLALQWRVRKVVASFNTHLAFFKASARCHYTTPGPATGPSRLGSGPCCQPPNGPSPELRPPASPRRCHANDALQVEPPVAHSAMLQQL